MNSNLKDKIIIGIGTIFLFCLTWFGYYLPYVWLMIQPTVKLYFIFKSFMEWITGYGLSNFGALSMIIFLCNAYILSRLCLGFYKIILKFKK